MTESLTLKWGTLKAWKLKTEESKAIMAKYLALGVSMGAMTQQDSPEQKGLICALIDAVDCDEIWNDWDGVAMTKAAAKEYVINYGVQRKTA